MADQNITLNMSREKVEAEQKSARMCWFVKSINRMLW
jgi:hypothetical protein